MNVTPPEASTEYSRGPEASRGVSDGGSGSSRSAAGQWMRAGVTATPGALGMILAGALLGALLLAVAEFTTLFTVHVSTSLASIKSEGTGSHDDFALIPIALAAAALGIGFWRFGSRPALLAIGVLGVIAFLIAILGDLPDAKATGLIGSSATHYVSASSTPSAGLYMETLGGVILVITCVCGFLMIGAPAGPPEARPAS